MPLDHALDDDSYLMAFHDALTPLMRRSTLPKALEFVSEQLRLAPGRCSDERRSHLFSIQGSILAALRMDTEALSGYREAEAVLPTDVQHKLTLANHLLYWHDRPAESLTKAEEALALARSREGESSWLGQARGLRGVALLRLGNIGAAQEAWAEILAIASAPEATPADLDLFLAAELIDARLLLPEVGQYLKMVALKAATTSSYDLSERCARVEEKLKAVQGE